MDLATPRAGGRATRLDELLEPLEVAAHAALEESERVSDLLGRVMSTGRMRC